MRTSILIFTNTAINPLMNQMLTNSKEKKKKKSSLKPYFEPLSKEHLGLLKAGESLFNGLE